MTVQEDGTVTKGTTKGEYLETRSFYIKGHKRTTREDRIPVVKLNIGVERMSRSFSTTKKSDKSKNEQSYFTAESSRNVRLDLLFRGVRKNVNVS